MLVSEVTGALRTKALVAGVGLGADRARIAAFGDVHNPLRGVEKVGETDYRRIR